MLKDMIITPSLDPDMYGLAELADWSEWIPFLEGTTQAPRHPGVYLIRFSGSIRYVGMARERSGKGIWGRLSKYRSGKAATSGFGEHAMDLALADTEWLMDRIEHLAASGPERTTEWAKLAIDRLNPELSWAVASSGQAAKLLEHQTIARLRPDGLLLNR
ncbi:hypothetical protein ACTQ49_05800 [Luteococcus sp. Sow4_B9]|uniref:hypothetical protein n=1 Tax=Luteococcus sp. Sow4_B9 TaxID=3438792 RepID=UPI003F9C06E5